MGDIKASEVAQAFHQWMLKIFDALPDDCWMSYGYPPPSGDLWEGVYLDDLLVLLIGRPRGFSSSGEPLPSSDFDLKLLEKVERAHREAGTRLHEQKRVRQATRGVVWGGEIAGREQQVSGEVASQHMLVASTAAVLLKGRVSYKIFTKISSSWVHHLTFKRSCLCLLDESFAHAQRCKDAGRGLPIPGSAVDELILCCLFAPMFSSS
jgi:hypothetical protein